MSQKWIERTVPGLHAHLAERVAAFPRDSSILDLGCGTGAWLKRLHDAGFMNLTGADANADQFQLQQAKFFKVDFDDGDLQPLVGRYDLITAIEFIEHLSNISGLLAFVSKNLAPKGNLLVSTPNVNSLTARLRLLTTGKLRHFDEFGDPTHVTPIFRRPFQSLLESYGLTMDLVWTYPEETSIFGSTTWSRYAVRAVACVLQDDLPGDILCAMIKRVNYST